MKKMTNKYDLAPNKEGVIGAWTGFAVCFIIFFVFGYLVWQWGWWIWFPVVGTLIGGITTTLQYFTMEPTQCPQCGQRVTEKKKFCPHCSHQFLWRCPNCNAKVRPDERFCDNCGFALQETVKPGEPTGTPTVSTPNPQFQNPSYEYCQTCGSHVDKDKQRYCPSCGMELK